MHNRVCIIGSGKMAEDIGLFLLGKKIDVLFTSISEERVTSLRLTFAKKYKRLARIKGEGEVGRFDVKPLGIIKDELFDLVIESTNEDLDKKKLVVNSLMELFPNMLILSNSSSINPQDIHSELVGVHFFYSVDMTNFVEIINDKNNKAKKFISKLDLSFIEENEKRQFIVNRMLLPLQAEALRLLQNGYGTEVINSSSMSDLIIVGQLTMMDSIGLDTILTASKNYLKFIDIENRRDYMPLVNGLSELIDNGCLGSKNGRGLLLEENLSWKRVKADMHPRIPFNLILINHCLDLIDKNMITIDELNMIFNLVFMSDITFADAFKNIDIEKSKDRLQKIYEKEKISYFKPSEIWDKEII